MSKYYITTSIPYLNSTAHIGHVLEFVQADVLARYHRLLGDDVWFLTGTDEHGLKIARSAEQAGKSEKEFVDSLAEHFRLVLKKYNISYNDFIRTSDQIRHWPAVVKIWNRLLEKGDLYKKKYSGFYCVGHESFLKKSELEKGVCPIHQTKPEPIEEENWFLRIGKYKKEIIDLIKNDELKIVPETRKIEILNVIADAEDVSVSRSNEKLKWGIPVPNDPSQTIFVWIDALTNYISALDYENNGENYAKFWPADAHLIGKDILRFHALIWPAILLSAGITLPKSIYVHGFVTIDNQKMSKTIGNIVDPLKLVEQYGIDPVRYFLLREIPSTEDGDFSYKKLEDRYNGDLANNLGNLVSRVAKLIETKLEGELNFDEKFFDGEVKQKITEAEQKYRKAVEEFKLHEALAHIWELFTFANIYIDEKKPWVDVAEHPEHFLQTITSLVAIIANAAHWLEPFLPETAYRILAIFNQPDLWSSSRFYSSQSDDYKIENPRSPLGSGQDTILSGQKFVVTKIKPLFPKNRRNAE